ncbi:YigZ family protein [Butyrivibrio sp. MC2013]|uniref:YigZ family protein n=1 Tax=Butyrivibrio sp. MC2013 TaxID=1280686 RepID=UPI00047E8979|nr:YigZ family protein [Butyrivibrio sp. MC2013]
MNNNSTRRIIVKSGRGEYEEKKSRFIGQAFAISSSSEAEEIIERISKEYWDARHNCYAYVLGERNEITRCSDNGEPSGTAGRPILDVLTTSGLSDALIIVTRYFGGTLLGTGGLVRAYTAAAKASLEDADVAELKIGVILQVTIAYSFLDKIQHSLSQMGLELSNPVYGADVSFDVTVTTDKADELEKTITGITGGRAMIVKGKEDYYPV